MNSASGFSAVAVSVMLSAASACYGAGAAAPLAADFSLASTGGFCQDGAWSQAPGKPVHLKIFGSFCAAGDRTVGTAKTTYFPAPDNLSLYLAGYPNGRDLTLFVENTASGEKFAIIPLPEPGDSWQRYTFALPARWRGQPIDLTGGDRSTAVHGWLAFSEPVLESSTDWGIRDALWLLIAAIVHFALLALPAMAACAWAAAKGIRNSVTLAGIALVAIAAVGYLGFWIYLLSPELGSHYRYGVDLAIGAAILFCIQFRRLDCEGRKALQSLILPAFLTGAAALLVLSTGFLYEGVSSPLETPARRFSHQLPPDNQIPFLLAEHVREGRIPRPMLGDWLSSDRPPLQTGIVLSQYAFMLRKALGYTVLSAILQSLWVLGAWSVLQSFQVDRRAAALALGVTLFSGFVFVNTFFVWPKLLAAAFLLTLTAYLHEIEQGRVKAGIGASGMAGSLAAFALLAHGGSAFGLLGLGLLAIFVGRRGLTWRLLGTSAMAFVFIYLPWILYQKVLDPPGDRLLKMHLAGVDKPDQRPVFETLVRAYTDLGFSGVLHNKLANLKPFYNHPLIYWSGWVELLSGSGQPGALAGQLRAIMFFEFFPALGLLGLCVVALAIGLNPGKRPAEWSAAARIWLLIGCTNAIWILLMFGPGTTFVHQGTYLTMILAFVGGALALWAVAPWVACTLGGSQIFLSLWLYFVLMREPVPNGPLMQGAASVSVGLLAVTALGATVAILGRIGYPHFAVPRRPSSMSWPEPSAPRRYAFRTAPGGRRKR